MKLDLAAALQQAGVEVFVARAVGDVPLPSGDDFEGLVALFEELHGVSDGSWLADEIARLAQQLDDAGLCAEDRLARELGVGLERGALDALGGLGEDATVFAQDRAQAEVKLAPPHHVGHVAERADHRDARTLVLLREVVRHDGHLDTE